MLGKKLPTWKTLYLISHQVTCITSAELVSYR